MTKDKVSHHKSVNISFSIKNFYFGLLILEAAFGIFTVLTVTVLKSKFPPHSIIGYLEQLLVPNMITLLMSLSTLVFAMVFLIIMSKQWRQTSFSILNILVQTFSTSVLIVLLFITFCIPPDIASNIIGLIGISIAILAFVSTKVST